MNDPENNKLIDVVVVTSFSLRWGSSFRRNQFSIKIHKNDETMDENFAWKLQY